MECEILFLGSFDFSAFPFVIGIVVGTMITIMVAVFLRLYKKRYRRLDIILFYTSMTKVFEQLQKMA